MGVEWDLAAVSDNVSEVYRARARDENLSQKEREAAQLIVTAKAHLDDEDGDVGIKHAKSALALCRETQDDDGIAVVTRLIIQCLCLNDKRKEANQIARVELESIRASKHRRGESKLLLSIAEVNTERRGNKNREEAKELAWQALKLFEEEGDRAMEASARLALLNINIKWKGDRMASSHEGLEHGKVARTLFKSLGDKRGEALTLHGIAVIHIRAEMFGIVLAGSPGGWQASCTESARLFKECKNFKMYAFEKVCIAQWTVGTDALRARELAEEAMKICQKYKSRQEAFALNVLVQTYLAMKDVSPDFGNNEAETAIELAKQGLQRFRERGNRPGEACALHSLVQALQAKGGERQEAMKHAAEAADIYREIREKGGETTMLQQLSQMHLEEQEPEKAFELAKEVTELNVSLHETSVAYETRYNACIAQGDFHQALDIAEELVLLCSDKGDIKREATARLMVATVHFNLQDYDQCKLVAREAQVLLHDIGNWQGVGNALQLVGEVSLAKEHYVEALKAAERSVRLLQQRSRDPTRHSEAAVSLLLVAQVRLSMLSQETIQRKRGSPIFAAAVEDAIRAAEAAVDYIRDKKIRDQEGYALLLLGQVQSSAMQPDEALKNADAAMDLLIKMGDQRQQANAMCLQASAHLTLDNADKALVLVNKALAIFEDIGDRRGEYMAMHILEQITGPQEEEAPLTQDQWTPEQWAQWEEWQKQQRAKGGGKGGSTGPPAQLQKAQQNQRQSRAVTGDKLNMSNLSVDTVRDRLNEIVKATVGLEESEAFDLDQPLMQVGITSRSAVELRNTLSEELPGVDLPFTLIFDYPSVASISDMVMDSLGGVG